jgi:hypothetical protein
VGPDKLPERRQAEHLKPLNERRGEILAERLLDLVWRDEQVRADPAYAREMALAVLPEAA